MADLSSPYPLRDVLECHLQELCHVLWGWNICSDCKSGRICPGANCQWHQSKQLIRYFEHYKTATSNYVPELLPGSSNGLRRHEDLFAIIRLLKAEPDVPRADLERRYFSERHGPSTPLPSLADQHRAFNLAVRVMMMVNCSNHRRSSGLLELGSMPFPWRGDATLGQFITMAFPMTDHPSLNAKDSSSRDLDVKAALAAVRLKKAPGLSFQPTDDLRNHLKLDQKRGVVEIYHHAAFLKQHLLATKSIGKQLSTSDVIRL